MLLKPVSFLLLLFSACFCYGQKGKDSLLKDTAFLDYDEIFSELDALLDSLNMPRNFSLLDVTVGNSYFSYVDKDGTSTQTRRQFTYVPSFGFFSKSGFGLSAGASFVNNGTAFSPYQYSVTGSYDFLKVKKIITGLSLTRFFTKKDLPFYTSPLQNELYGYFTMRKLWFKPSVGASYGWGSRNAFEQREQQIENIQLSRRGFARINTAEKIIDLSLLASVRHDFYFLHVFSPHDYARITPQVSFTSGTQQFGFNQTTTTFGVHRLTGKNVLYDIQNISLDNNLYFQPLSVTGYLKTEYTKGIFFFQPQVIFDYYFPATKNHFTTNFLVSAGLLF